MLRNHIRNHTRNQISSPIDRLTGIDLSDYNFYVAFPEVIDQVSGQLLTTALSATRYGYAGGEFGENVPVIESGKLLTNGGYTQLIKKSEDISDAVWSKDTNVIVTGTDGFTAGARFDFVRQAVTTIEGSLYTISFIASVAPAGHLTGYDFYHVDSATGNYTTLELTEIPTLYSATVLGKIGGGTLNFGIRDQNLSNWAKVTITDFQVTASPYRLPYVPNATTGTISVPLNYSDANEGPKAIGMAANFPQLLDALDGVADGAIKFSDNFSSDTTGLYNANDSTISYNAVDEAIKATFTTATAIKGVYRTNVVDVGVTYGVEFRARGTRSTAFEHLFNADAFALSNPVLTTQWQDYCFRVTSVDTVSRYYLGAGDIGDWYELDDIVIKEISPAKGRMIYQWPARFDAADVSGVVHILTANDDATSFLFYNGATQEIHAYDGTNTAVVACTPVNGTEYQIILDYGDNSGQKMRLMVDTTVGTAVTHAGSFPITSDDLSIAWNEEVPQEVKSIIIEKEPIWVL